MKNKQMLVLWIVAMALIIVPVFFIAVPCLADESLCAVVKIEIDQELTLERQAFDAHMRINNGLSHIGLENVSISISFTDSDGNPVGATSDPNDTSARFYFREDSKTNINDTNGNGSVAPSTSADIHWLIIPAPGASNGLIKGKLYNVGATLAYTLGGEAQETIVSPDSILVKPMPQMVLDYFLPMDVYGDDAFTDTIEPPIPFSLGVRVKNNGRGTAQDLKIESAQPKITENEQGLLIGFSIQGSQTNGKPAEKTLLADFGDVGPQEVAMARWLMTCSLSGRFVAFNADFSHSDELGGALTSLVDTIQTHFLIRDVRVDLVGRDKILDFLAKNDDRYRVYESDGVDTQVDDQSASTILTSLGLKNDLPAYSLTTAINQGFVYVQSADPFQGKKVIHSAIRSDGKIIKPDNIWLSKCRKDKNWDYLINLFDVRTTGKYTLIFEEPAVIPEAPVLQYIADVTAIEGERISFVVQASDPDGTMPSLSATALPAGSRFADAGDGTAIFEWTSAIGQSGTYSITFKASDGILEDSQIVAFTVRSIVDTDGDGMRDEWELEYFGTLDRNGSGDFDQDNVSDLDEHLVGSDPATVDHAPTIPEILSPRTGGPVTFLAPNLEIQNSTDPDNDKIAYQFELYEDKQFTELVFADDNVPQTLPTTVWQIPAGLYENSHYFWRVRATDGYSFSQWAYGNFYVNATDEPPMVRSTIFPPDGSEVGILSPVLQVSGISDPDREILFCSFEVYEEMSMSTLVAEAHGMAVPVNGIVRWPLEPSLTDGILYFWHAIVTDEQGLQTKTAPAAFTVNTANRSPSAPVISFPIEGQEISDFEVTLTVENAFDSDGDSVFYDFEIDTSSHFDSPHKRRSILIGEGIGTTSWHVSDLKENTVYSWRVRATDTASTSSWVGGRFFVNEKNDRPHAPNLKNPGNDAWVGKRTPDLCTTNGVDPDGDSLSYRFEVYADPALENLVAWGETFSPTWTVATELADRTRYYWRARLIDEHGAEGDWMPVASFFVSEEELPLPEEIAVQVLTDKGKGLQHCKVYAFTSSSSYTGVHATTGPDGTAVIDIDALVPGVYRFRADYLGKRFWSEAVSVPEISVATIMIQESTVVVTAETALGAVADARVYLFSESGAYLGLYRKTDAKGQVSFSLPTDETFLFRADILGTRYWSDKITVTANASNRIMIDAGGGTLQLAVRRNATDPMVGIKTYLFNAAGTYLGVSQTTDASGIVEFDVTEAAYQIRANLLGNKFWSESIHVIADTIETMVIEHRSSILTVQGCFQDIITPLDGIKTYLFSSEGSYLGKFLKTDAEGQAVFDLPEKEFKIRADVFGGQYWSEPFVWDDPVITIPIADALVSVTGTGQPKEGAKVYVFNQSDSYLGVNGSTNSDGNVIFRLPEGSYGFRVDYQGNQYWAQDRTLAADEMTEIAISLGGGTFQLRVEDNTGSPLVGVKCYVFNDKNSYLGLSGSTDETGMVGFNLSGGIYRFRVDYLGNSFWKEDMQVIGDMESSLVIPHNPVSISAIGDYQGVETPFPTVPVYLFSPSGAYLGRFEKTDVQGQVTFNLPEKPYMVRVDAVGDRFWSDLFVWADTTVRVDEGQVAIRVVMSGSPVEDSKVYLFSDSNRYLGQYQVTETDGTVRFTLPEGQFRFRSDLNGQQLWTDIIEVNAHAETFIEMAMD